MSDLSMLSLAPKEADVAIVSGERGRGVPFAWPTPPYAGYPSGQPQAEPEPCEIEGLNGKIMHARLALFDPEQSLAQVQVPPARTTMPLRLSQFRRITLTNPLRPLPPEARPGSAGQLLQFHPQISFHLKLVGGGEMRGKTVGHVENSRGVFLFLPVDDQGAVQRVFCPRAAYERAEFGEPLGETLVAERSATPEQIRSALAEQGRLRERRIGDVLVNQKVVTPEQMAAALEAQSRMPMVRIGEALMALGYIQQQQLDDALALQRKDRTVPLGELLVRAGHIQRNDLRTALARKMGYPVVDVEAFPVELEALKRIPASAARRLEVLPLQALPGRLVVAIEDPSRRDVLDELEFIAQGKVVPVLPASEHLSRSIGPAYQKHGLDDMLGGGYIDVPPNFDEGGTDKLLADLEQDNKASDRDDLEDAPIEQADNSLVRLINTMIVEAHQQGVSDIHVETQPGREKVRIRFRRDGMLKPYVELPHTYRSALIARLKIMCDLDISERRRPQDGKINFSRFVPGCNIELRVATIPTANGLEDAVMRILASAKPIPLDKLGMSPKNLAVLKAAIERPYGMVLCVGPTGSGKTTTLHSALSYINVPERKIWTAEDPVEITQVGLRQVQVNPKIDWTFAKALRAFLRADPDVIMVGEIRDGETARIAVESSLTGHLVLSTLHTNSAAETITRLLDMGMDPFNFADSLLAVLAQRLVRRICPHCRQASVASPERIEEWLDDYQHAWGHSPDAPSRNSVLAEWRERFGTSGGQLMHYHSPGCEKCDHTGVRGRAGIHELLSVSKGIRRLIQTGARAEEIHHLAMTEGLRTLRQDGIEKVLAGLTTVEEVRATSNV